jgi:hypothetical protein
MLKDAIDNPELVGERLDREGPVSKPAPKALVVTPAAAAVGDYVRCRLT